MASRPLLRHGSAKFTGDESFTRNQMKQPDRVNSGRWEVKLGFGQVLITWGVITGLMVAIFFLGFSKGTETGIEHALYEHSSSDIRLPIIGATPPAATAKGYQSIAAQGVTGVATDERLANFPNQKLQTGTTTTSQLGTAGGYSERPVASVLQATAGSNLPRDGSATILDRTAGSNNLQPGWYVQLAVMKKLEQANAVITKAQATGLQPQIEQTSKRGVNFFRVILGPYPQKEAAILAMENAKNSKLAAGRMFIHQIN